MECGIIGCLKMKRPVIGLLSTWAKALRAVVTGGMTNPSGENGRHSEVIIRVEGGICSQIAFVALGEFLTRRLGARVKYDLTWYRDCGMDADGRQVRNWDFPKAFPSVRLQEASDSDLAALSKHHTYRDFDLSRMPSAMHFIGYSHRAEALWEMRGWLKEMFRPAIGSLPESEIPSVETRATCAIHVRRGDLSSGSDVHGIPTSVAYYSQAMRLVVGLEPDVRFFIFTDDAVWAREHVLPAVPEGRPCELMEHGSDRGYLDLYLISRCAYVISSIGSLGRFGAFLSDREPTLIMSCLRSSWCANLKNVIYLNDDRETLRRTAADSSGL